jgi:hypothetical protein
MTVMKATRELKTGSLMSNEIAILDEILFFCV